MEDLCQFCGAAVKDQWTGWDRLKCESIRYNSDGTFETFYSRTGKCYEVQLTALGSLAREMGKLLLNHQIAITGAQEAEAYDATDKFLNRPAVKALLSPPREPDHQPEEG